MRQLLFLLTCFLFPLAVQAQEDAQTKYYNRTLRPVLDTHCFSCHNASDKKGGINLQDYYFAIGIVRNGATWVDVINQIRSGDMPPSNKPPIPSDDKTLLIEGISSILDSALSDPDPGQVVMRRLSNREYRYTVLDLLGVDFDTHAFFPADGSGGEGFDNQAKTLYVSPLLMERYLAAVDSIVAQAYADHEVWQKLVPDAYEPGLLEQAGFVIQSFLGDEQAELDAAKEKAAQILFPLATRAYRRFLKPADKEQLLSVFSEVYHHLQDAPDRFDVSLQESIKFLLLSPHFLYRREADRPSNTPYLISGFELASRLSYFLWSSAPDDELLNVAYRENLHDSTVMRTQLERMLADPRASRLAASFAGQWLEIDKLLDGHQVDPTLYPDFSPTLRLAMHDEAVAFFHHVLTKSQNFLDLLDSDYTFLNEELAAHYGIEMEVSSEKKDARSDKLEARNSELEIQKTTFPDNRRGGVLGMGGVLTVTSLPTRTSAVLRGKYVLEQLLGTPPPPPPADVPDLEAVRSIKSELDLRELLSLHREPTSCYGCHQKMDPLGLGLENFDAVGRWRNAYTDAQNPIDASGTLPNGESFTGPAALRQILLNKKDLFARNLSRKMLSFALGRGIRFQDKRTVDALTETLIANDFNTVDFLHAVANSYPFRYKKSDLPETATSTE